jgi:hypothetical protein
MALAKASQCVGVTFAGRFLSPDNLGRFRAELSKRVESVAPACADLPGLLQRRSAEVGLGGDTPRIGTARSADQLCVALRGKSGVEQVRALVAYEPQTNGPSVGVHVGQAAALVTLLRDEFLFGVFEQLAARKDELAGAAELLEHVQAALRQDESHVALGERIKDLGRQAQRLLHPETRAPNQHVVFQKRVEAHGPEAARGRLRQLVDEIETELERGGEAVDLVVTATVTKRS